MIKQILLFITKKLLFSNCSGRFSSARRILHVTDTKGETADDLCHGQTPTAMRRASSSLKNFFPKRRDHLLVCGDFGFVWDGSEKEKKRLARLEHLDCMILFIEGVHDNLDLLAACPEEEYCGGRVRRVGKNILWMQRGELFTIDGMKIFAPRAAVKAKMPTSGNRGQLVAAGASLR